MYKKEDKLTLVEYINMLPYIILALSPIIVHGNIVNVSPEAKVFWNEGLVLDYFSYTKSYVIIIAGFLGVMVSIYRLFIDKISIKMSKIYIPLAFFAITVIISHFFSEYPLTSLYGLPERYEGFLVHLSYILVFITFPINISKDRQVKIIVYAILLVALIISGIGVAQSLGYDILKSGKILRVINSTIPDFNSADLNNLITKETSKNHVYSTLYNSNTFGHYMAMLFSFVLFLIFVIENRFRKFILCLLSLLIFIGLITSQSRGSFIGVTTAIILFGIIFKKALDLKLRDYMIILVSVTIVFIFSNSFVEESLISRYASIMEFGTNHEEDEQIDKIKGFTIRNRVISVSTSNQLLHVYFERGISLYDENFSLLEYRVDDKLGSIEIDNKDYSDFEILIIDNYLRIGKGSSFLVFANDNNKILFLNPRGEVLRDYTNEYPVYGIERIGSGRGFIWSRTIPLLRDRLLIGSGLDSFIYEFPQDDYKGKLKYMYDAYIIIDKPHNLFLQTAINSGIVSLISYIAIMIIWIYKSIRIISDNVNSLLIPLVPAIVSYLIVGMFTDSSVSVTATFWLFMGIGLYYHNRYGEKQRVADSSISKKT